MTVTLSLGVIDLSVARNARLRARLGVKMPAYRRPMAVTRSWTAKPFVVSVAEPAPPRSELVWLVAASLFVATALGMVYSAKVHGFTSTTQLVNLNAVESPEELAPLFALYPDATQREDLARETFEFLERARPLRNVGALTALRTPGTRRPLLPLAKLKPLMTVRTPGEFQRTFLLWAGLYFAGFYLVALVWKAARFAGDRSFLPALQLLTGIGLALMASMRDPLRDTLEFHKFALGVFLGCLLLILPALSFFDYRRLSDWCYTPLFGALGLFGALLVFGRGPAGNDAKVNLGPFQPVELIKILLVLFLAGYFTRNWERLRDLRNRVGTVRLQHVVPVLCATGVSLLFFFVLKDLGPALVTFFVFLSMFAVARGRPALALAGLALMVGSVAVGIASASRTRSWSASICGSRRGITTCTAAINWRTPLGPLHRRAVGLRARLGRSGNDSRRQYRSGAAGDRRRVGLRGRGGGVPAVRISGDARAAGRRAMPHVFRLLPGAGAGQPDRFRDAADQRGRAGRAAAFGRGVAIPQLRKHGDARQLPGVRAAAFHFGRWTAGRGPYELLQRPTGYLKAVLACAMLVLLAAAARYQVLKDRDYLARDAHAFEADGVKRPQHNPRMNSLAREIPRGTIYDRNGIPVATSSWAELERHRPDYQALGVSLEQAASRFDNRHYPFGAALALVLGDLRTGENFHATNASLVEHDSTTRLQGYEYAELAAWCATGISRAIRPSPAAGARPQCASDPGRPAAIARQGNSGEAPARSHTQNGAVVVMDAGTGDVLAMVSAPAPDPPGSRPAAPTPDELLDRARYGQYPPGSTFKLVTAIAALRLIPNSSIARSSAARCPTAARATPLRAGIAPSKTISAIARTARSIWSAPSRFPATRTSRSWACTMWGRRRWRRRRRSSASRPAIRRSCAKRCPSHRTGRARCWSRPSRWRASRRRSRPAARCRKAAGSPTTATAQRRACGGAARTQAAFLAGAMRRVVTEGTARHAMAGKR